MANTAKEKASGDEAAARKATSKSSAAAAATPKPARSQSPADRIRALEAEIDRIRRDEFDARYNLITQAIDELNAMGHKFRLVDDNKGAVRTGKKPAATGPGSSSASPSPAPNANGPASGLSAHYDEKKYCKLCREHGHDQKAHSRAGDFQSKAFSNEEKARRGVLPPELQESFVAEHPESQG